MAFSLAAFFTAAFFAAGFFSLAAARLELCRHDPGRLGLCLGWFASAGLGRPGFCLTGCSFGFSGSGRWLFGRPLRHLGRDQFQRLFQRDVIRRNPLGQGGIDLAVSGIGAIAAAANLHAGIVIRMVAQHAQNGRAIASLSQ